ncbi:DUF6361 family protein [Salinibacterium amurskyense]|uniref:DUF6361 family protein n=1 Tax=Salinibacterium amurskyense TaxID=205941 RepID=UPI000C236FBB|nr:DUF6361 family protein [Salinibacterium amurskyense]RLQ83783.1 hypothetical protein D9C83_00680 [Salinibacterium amurskyense]
MPSLIAWLDASSEDQRRMREIVNLFSERDSRDELGVGQVRDVLSDTLFPGTSTLLTRARYMILIPWAFTAAVKHGVGVDEIARRVDKNERNLIGTLKRETDGEGLLGKTAGVALKNLPSSTYWAALRQYEILSDPSQNQADAIATSIHSAPADDDESHSTGPWSPTLPPVPANFPHDTEGGFDLSRTEAEWLRDRMLKGSEGTLLAHLLDHRPQADSDAPWQEPATLDAPESAARELVHARMFSLAFHGTSLLYNLLLAETYEAAGNDRVTGRAEAYRERVSRWQNDRDAASSSLSTWDRKDFWALIDAKNPRINPRSRAFINSWLEAVTGPESLVIADDEDLRSLIRQREHQHKGPQARLYNSRLLQTWQGASGASALTFRWRQVRGILADLHDGLERADA